MAKYLFPKGHRTNVGRKASLETRQKMSSTHKELGHGKWMQGRNHSEEQKQKISASMKKYKMTLEHRKHISQSRLGKPLSTEHCQALSEAQKRMGTVPPSRRGTVPWNYCGATLLQEQIRKSFEYRQWRSNVFTRDDFTCQKCGARGNKLHAHHKKPFAKILKEYNITTFTQALACAELWNINNGETLCGDTCHRMIKCLIL